MNTLNTLIPTKDNSKEPREKPLRYRLVIEGDAKLMRQITDAVEAQGRLHLGQFGSIPDEIERGICDRAEEAGISLNGVASGPDDIFADLRADSMRLLKESWISLTANHEQWWRSAFRARHSPLESVSPHLSRRQKRSYSLWKWLEHCLLNQLRPGQGEAPPYNNFSGNVHYEIPTNVAADVKVALEPINPSADVRFKWKHLDLFHGYRLYKVTMHFPNNPELSRDTAEVVAGTSESDAAARLAELYLKPGADWGEVGPPEFKAHQLLIFRPLFEEQL